jgi:hypothetical protein
MRRCARLRRVLPGVRWSLHRLFTVTTDIPEIGTGAGTTATTIGAAMVVRITTVMITGTGGTDTGIDQEPQ